MSHEFKITCGPSGPTDAEVALIGEAPGREEARDGRPFVGEAGRLLSRLCEVADVNRNDLYMDNVIRIRPENNKVEEFLDIGRGKETDVYLRERNALVSRLNSLPNLKLIIAAGAVPLYALTGKKGIVKWRGSLLPSLPDLKCKRVMAMRHPAAALDFREYLLQRLIAHDLQKAMQYAELDDFPPPNFQAILEPAYKQCVEYLGCILEKKLTTACDIEVLNDEMSCISFCTPPGEDGLHRPISIPFFDYKNWVNYFIPPQEDELMLLITRVLESPDIKKIFQNGIFDMGFLLTKYGIKTQNFDDTMIAQHILMPDYNKGLDFITSIYTNHAYYKDDGKQWKRLNWDQKEFWLYNAKDSLVCMEAMPKLVKELEKQGNVEAYNRMIRLMTPLMCIEYNGIRCDLKGMGEDGFRIEEEMADIQEQLNTLVGHPLNVNSPKQMREHFYGDEGLNLRPYLKKGKITTDVDAMKRIARRGYKEARLVLELRERSKLKGTYLDMALDEDERFRGAQNPAGATTGRISSGMTLRGTGGNMHNQPPRMKKFFLADDGKWISDFDFGQAENRIVAELAEDDAMRGAFERGEDVHSLTAALISGKKLSEIKEETKLFEESNGEEGCAPLGDGSKPWRYWGKMSNHALNYGLGYKTFAMKQEIPEGEAKDLVEKYHEAYPGVRGVFHKSIQRELRENKRTLVNLLGRKRPFLDKIDNNLYMDAYSYKPQSTVADMMWEYGVIWTYENICSHYDVDILNCVHDSLVLQWPIDLPFSEVAELMSQIKKNMETPLTYKGRSFVIPVDIKMGLNMKDMEDVTSTADDLEGAYECLREKQAIG